MPPSAERRLLARGQCLHLHLPPGTRLVCLRGRVAAVAPPCWLGGQMLTVQHRLGEGDVLVTDAGGWVKLEAGTASELVLVAPPPGIAARAIRKALGWRRLLAGKATGGARAV